MYMSPTATSEAPLKDHASMNGPRTVGIVGLGYVGLPLLLAYAKAGKRASDRLRY